MFELFGLVPLLKVLLVGFLTTYLSFFFGNIIARDKTNNYGIIFIVGTIVLCSLYAIIINWGKSIFTPALVSLIILFKPSFKLIKQAFVDALKPSLSFFVIFLVCFFLQLAKEPYFSTEYISTTYTDYSFYISAMQDILLGGGESTIGYLSNYGIEVDPNIYHFYDLYLLLPVFIFKIPPLVGYVYFLNSFLFSIAIYCLTHLFSVNKRKQVLLIAIGLISICLTGIILSDFSPIYRYSVTYFPKCTVFFAIVMMLKLEGSLNRIELLTLLLIVGLVVNPLLFAISLIPIIILFIRSLLNGESKLSQLFSIRLLLIFSLFLAYLLFIFVSKSDNSILYTFKGEITLSEFFKGFLYRFKGYLGMYQHFPLLVLAGLIYIYRFFRFKQFNLILFFSFLMLLSGQFIASVMHNHYEGTQLFYIVFTPFLAIIFYYSFRVLYGRKELLYKIGFWIFISFTLISYLNNGYQVFTKPRVVVKSSIEFNRNLMANKEQVKIVKAIHFRVFNEKTRWIKAVPFLVYDIGYLHLYQNSHVVQAISTSFFEDKIKFPPNAMNLIANGPFQKYCNELDLYPKSFNDPNYYIVLKEFIEENEINTLIFDRDFEIPSWIENFNLVEKVNPIEKYDKHIIYILL